MAVALIVWTMLVFCGLVDAKRVEKGCEEADFAEATLALPKVTHLLHVRGGMGGGAGGWTQLSCNE